VSNIQQFTQNKWTVLKGAVSNELCRFISQYALFDELQDFSPEQRSFGENCQVPLAHSKYADPAMESLLLYMLPTIEQSTGLKLDPTYSYFRVYRVGDVLKDHVDRPSCEISATICFGFKDPTLWPIHISDFEVLLEQGDVLIYRGHELYHRRDSMPGTQESWQVQGFLHYVDKNGPYSNLKYDGRESLGLIRKEKLPRYVTEVL
jgi:hypothetical protein